MNSKRSLKALLLAVVFCAVGMADTHSSSTALNELVGGTKAHFNFNNGTNAGLNVGYNYLVSAPFQVGADLSYVYSTLHAVTALGVVTVNFPFDGDLSEAYFLNGKVGINYVNTPSTVSFAFGFNLGKRCQIVPGVVYRPSVGMSKVGAAKVDFHITPVEFGFSF